MKTKLHLLALVLLLIFSQFAFAQTVIIDTGSEKKIRTIELDFKGIQKDENINIIKVPKIQEGDFYRIKVKNVNLNMYKVEINAVDTVLSQKKETPTFGSLNLDDLGKIVANIASSNGAILKSIGDSITKGILSTDEMSLHDQNKIKANGLLTDIGKRMDGEKTELEKFGSEGMKIAEEIDELKLKIFEFRASSEGNPNKIAGIFGTESLSIDFKKEYEKIKDFVESAQNHKKSANTMMESYLNFAKLNKDAIEKNPVLAANDVNIKEGYTKFIAAMDLVISSFTADKIIELFTPLIYLKNNQTAEFTSLPIQFLGEQAKVKISITPRDESKLSQKYQTQIVFPGVIKKYTTVGISFYGANLYDESYTLEKFAVNDSVSNYKIKPEKLNKMEIGVAMLLRHGKKFDECNDFGGHFSIGAGMSIANKIKPRLLFGGGLSFGKKHMLSVDLGVVVGYSDRINENALNATHDEVPTDVVYSKLMVRLFGGLGYIYQF